MSIEQIRALSLEYAFRVPVLPEKKTRKPKTNKPRRHRRSRVQKKIYKNELPIIRAENVVYDALHFFWQQVSREIPTKDDGPKRLEILTAYADLKFEKLEGIREEFGRRKNKLMPMTRASHCFVCWARAHVRHHIIGVYRGGDNSGRNMVFLCEKCHIKIHPWLKRPDLRKRIYEKSH